jgi:hypothetical protein
LYARTCFVCGLCKSCQAMILVQRSSSSFKMGLPFERDTHVCCVFAVSIFLRGRSIDSDGRIMQLPTCAARFDALGLEYLHGNESVIFCHLQARVKTYMFKVKLIMQKAVHHLVDHRRVKYEVVHLAVPYLHERGNKCHYTTYVGAAQTRDCYYKKPCTCQTYWCTRQCQQTASCSLYLLIIQLRQNLSTTNTDSMEADAAPAGVSAHIVRRHLIYTRMAQDVHIKGLYIGGVITQASAPCPVCL